MADDIIHERAEVSELDGFSGRKRIATGKPYFTGKFGVGEQTGETLKKAPAAHKESHPFKAKSPHG